MSKSKSKSKYKNGLFRMRQISKSGKGEQEAVGEGPAARISGGGCMASSPAPAALAQVRLDAASVLARVQTALSFQVATALQVALDAFLARGVQLAALVLLCVALQAAAALGRVPVETVRGVLVVQVGQTLQGLLVFKDWTAGSTERLVQGFLVNTLGLCVPSVLELLSPRFVASPYVQNALSVWLFQYASSTREVLASVDFGVSPAVVCLLAFALSVSARRLGSSLEALYKYIARAWHMLLVDWLLRTLALSTAGAPTGLQIALLAMVVLVVDALALEHQSMLRDVRGYTVFRIAGELQGLGVLSRDRASAVGAALLAFCAHTSLGALQLRSRVASSVAEVFLVASANVLVQSATSGEAAVAQQLLRAGLVCVLTYAVQAALTDQGDEAAGAGAREKA